MGSDYFPVDDSKQKKDLSKILNDEAIVISKNNNNLFSNENNNVKWEDIQISGYKITPYFSNCKDDPLNNSYGFTIDWQLVNEEVYNQKLQSFKTNHPDLDEDEYEQSPEFQKEIAEITAHSVATNNLKSNLNDNKKQDDVDNIIQISNDYCYLP